MNRIGESMEMSGSIIFSPGNLQITPPIVAAKIAMAAK
jgi:hypothetical protein